MFLDICVPLFINFFIYNNAYSHLINCILITIGILLKVTFYNNIVYKILEILTLSSLLFYIIDTFRILYNGKTNFFIVYHICYCQLLLSKYIFNYDVYISCILLFIIELSNVYYLYYKFINTKLHIYTYIPLRIILNVIIIYFILYENSYTHYIELFMDLLSYILLFIYFKFMIVVIFYFLK